MEGSRGTKVPIPLRWPALPSLPPSHLVHQTVRSPSSRGAAALVQDWPASEAWVYGSSTTQEDQPSTRGGVMAHLTTRRVHIVSGRVRGVHGKEIGVFAR